ncbi:hypothetical protein Mal64_34530 [Pseudobythopirellula maris]|uniref:Prenyltransferase and squalene oxidase repeat protein n=1 Tax=Pseudobythopirellula maris TaxID=2527991 RepID=A0A5C5ZHP1_9BACT|nr:hypothetical protein [Pseudobythopirellula maris]TWT86625.1 hypothetical protein Mal64_34530 [Pseudobythopirellula maris]
MLATLSNAVGNFVRQALSLSPGYVVLWTLLAVASVALVVMMRRGRARSRPWRLYAMASVVAHLVLIVLTTTVRLLSAPVGDEGPAPVKVRIVTRVAEQTIVAPEPLEAPETEPVPDSGETPEVEAPVETQLVSEPAEPTEPTPQPPEPPSPQPEPVETAQAEPPPQAVAEAAPAPPVAEERPIEPTPPSEALAETTPLETVIEAQSNEPLPPVEPPRQAAPAPPVPAAPRTAFSARNDREKLRRLEDEGGDRYTEDAVARGLAWLAYAQSRDGRWDASRWSAGRELQVLGVDRNGAGTNSDTGVSGLALLAFLGAGHTHLEGPFANPVAGGLQYLIDSQRPDGDLSGDSALFAKTYCHSMATFALAEALATTGDERLRDSVDRAIGYLVRGQSRTTGGWRYRPGDRGDMSQMGWALMALRSAELARTPVPAATWGGVEKFVRSVEMGKRGGLACYQPRGPVSRTMTAEALYCRQILGSSHSRPGAAVEAIDHLLGQLPHRSNANLYYWYYGTLALHHHRHASRDAERAWRLWNDALKRTLLSLQIDNSSGHFAQEDGSWNPSTRWGGYGGRVYTTALATMCLEVYYRYDPDETARDPWIAARTDSGAMRR